MHLHTADTAPQSPHPTAAPITSDFASTWPAVETPLRRYLGSIGVNRHDIDDLVQETAARVIASKVPYDGPGELRAWSFVVARRLLSNMYRARRRHVDLDDAQRLDPTQDDLLVQVEDRLILEKVAASVLELTAAERRHLAGHTIGTPAELNRARVARHRARQHLRKLVGPLAVIVTFLRRRATLASAGASLAALSLPFVLLPATVHHDEPVAQPLTTEQQGTQLATETSLVQQPTASKTRQAASRPPASAPTRPEKSRPTVNMPAIHARGPADSNAHAAIKNNDGKQHVVCTTGTIAGDKCVDLPPGIG